MATGEEFEARGREAHAQGLDCGFPDLSAWVSEGVPDHVYEAFDVHIEDCRGVLGHLLQNEAGSQLGFHLRLPFSVSHTQPPNCSLHLECSRSLSRLAGQSCHMILTQSSPRMSQEMK